jgi:hypothetical protein
VYANGNTAQFHLVSRRAP